jgi:UDP-N-acetylglucosamine 3-dehydrogenase
MTPLRVGFIGTGLKPEKPGPLGYGMAHHQAVGYRALPGQAQIVACCDLHRSRAASFAGLYDVPAKAVYTDYHEMLAKEKLDIVSVATWPDVHAQIVCDAARARPKGIFCEKPMAYTWGDCKRMVAAAVANDVKLGFHHQRRYGKPFRMARQLIEQGAIGKLLRVEFGAGDLYEYGSHNFDLCAYLAGCTKGKWAMGQIDYSQWKVVFDTHNENTALGYWEYENGVQGFAATGRCANFVNSHHRAIGADGVIEMGPRDPAVAAVAATSRHLRYRVFGKSDWEYIDTQGEHVHGPGYIERAIADFVATTAAGKDSEINGSNALDNTEIIFALWHSSRIHGIVELPLRADDNALVSMVNSGDLRPR